MAEEQQPKRDPVAEEEAVPFDDCLRLLVSTPKPKKLEGPEEVVEEDKQSRAS